MLALSNDSFFTHTEVFALVLSDPASSWCLEGRKLVGTE